jgi:hypothetical protein
LLEKLLTSWIAIFFSHSVLQGFDLHWVQTSSRPVVMCVATSTHRLSDTGYYSKPRKDQSYVLFPMQQDELARGRFTG